MKTGINFLNILDQIRYISGALSGAFLFCIYAAPKRGYFRGRLILGYMISFVAAMCFLPLSMYMNAREGVWIVVSMPYWLFMSFVPVAVMLFCFEMNAGSALFRCLLGGIAESVVTTVIRYIFVMLWFPGFPEKHTGIYILFMAAVYVVCYYGFYHLAAKKMQKDDGKMYFDALKTTITFFCVYISYVMMIGLVKVACEFIIMPLLEAESLSGIFLFIRYFCVSIILLLNISLFVILYHVYEVAVLQNEKRFVNQLLAEKESQYEFSKENIDLINRKCHDLKHHLKALELAGDEERQELLQETKQAVVFYDAVVNTGNEVLDTILTEKSMLCANRNIRISCTVSTACLECFRVIDLYTMLGNAIDNAIECVDQFTDGEKKIISLSIREQGSMVYIAVENYYEGEIVLRHGYPVTQKKDPANHGFGIRSIHMLAKRYDGDIRVSIQNHIFLLQIIIPVNPFIHA